MKSTFGAPSLARLGAGHAGLETSNVRPITPGKACPGLYSLSDMMLSFTPHGSRQSHPTHARAPVSADSIWGDCRFGEIIVGRSQLGIGLRSNSDDAHSRPREERDL